MKKVYRLALGMCLLLLTSSSNITFSQNLVACREYPTADEELNSLVVSLHQDIKGFQDKFNLLYESLNSTDQQSVATLINNSDEKLFSSFPQFNDTELGGKTSSIKDLNVAIWIKHEKLFPDLDSSQRKEIIKGIIQCYSSKALYESFPNSIALDPCEAERRNCIAAVAAESAVMHLGCAALDLTFFAGIICHSAALIYQHTAGNNCNIAARRCMEGRQ